MRNGPMMNIHVSTVLSSDSSERTLLNVPDRSTRNREGVLSEKRESSTDEYTSTQEYVLFDYCRQNDTTCSGGATTIVH
jgi:hypothetical protein